MFRLAGLLIRRDLGEMNEERAARGPPKGGGGPLFMQMSNRFSLANAAANDVTLSYPSRDVRHHVITGPFVRPKAQQIEDSLGILLGRDSLPALPENLFETHNAFHI